GVSKDYFAFPLFSGSLRFSALLHQAGYCQTLDPTENDGVPITAKWTAGGVTWLDTYQEHLRQVGAALPAFDWHREA
ncbi:unnamed protein product, partial [Hapterophycus canaliculatus]